MLVDVLCGELPPEGARVHADVVLRAGGSAVNAAIAAAEAGAATTVIGRVGTDPSAELVFSALAERGIGARIARDPELPTGTAVALGSSVVASRGANAMLSVQDIPDPLDGDALLVSGFALFQSGSDEAACVALERFRGRWSAVDLASPKLAQLDSAAGANVILATAEEARTVTGAEPEEAAHALAASFELAVVKLGEEGAIAVTGDQVERATVERVERRSPFGAGDAFAGTVLVALGRGESLKRALQLACEAAARAAGLANP